MTRKGNNSENNHSLRQTFSFLWRTSSSRQSLSTSEGEHSAVLSDDLQETGRVASPGVLGRTWSRLRLQRAGARLRTESAESLRSQESYTLECDENNMAAQVRKIVETAKPLDKSHNSAHYHDGLSAALGSLVVYYRDQYTEEQAILQDRAEVPVEITTVEHQIAVFGQEPGTLISRLQEMGFPEASISSRSGTRIVLQKQTFTPSITAAERTEVIDDIYGRIAQNAEQAIVRQWKRDNPGRILPMELNSLITIPDVAKVNGLQPAVETIKDAVSQTLTELLSVPVHVEFSTGGNRVDRFRLTVSTVGRPNEGKSLKILHNAGFRVKNMEKPGQFIIQGSYEQIIAQYNNDNKKVKDNEGAIEEKETESLAQRVVTCIQDTIVRGLDSFPEHDDQMPQVSLGEVVYGNKVYISLPEDMPISDVQKKEIASYFYRVFGWTEGEPEGGLQNQIVMYADDVKKTNDELKVQVLQALKMSKHLPQEEEEALRALNEIRKEVGNCEKDIEEAIRSSEVAHEVEERKAALSSKKLEISEIKAQISAISTSDARQKQTEMEEKQLLSNLKSMLERLETEVERQKEEFNSLIACIVPEEKKDALRNAKEKKAQTQAIYEQEYKKRTDMIENAKDVVVVVHPTESPLLRCVEVKFLPKVLEELPAERQLKNLGLQVKYDPDKNQIVFENLSHLSPLEQLRTLYQVLYMYRFNYKKEAVPSLRGDLSILSIPRGGFRNTENGIQYLREQYQLLSATKVQRWLSFQMRQDLEDRMSRLEQMSDAELGTLDDDLSRCHEDCLEIGKLLTVTSNSLREVLKKGGVFTVDVQDDQVVLRPLNFSLPLTAPVELTHHKQSIIDCLRAHGFAASHPESKVLQELSVIEVAQTMEEGYRLAVRLPAVGADESKAEEVSRLQASSVVLSDDDSDDDDLTPQERKARARAGVAAAIRSPDALTKSSGNNGTAMQRTSSRTSLSPQTGGRPIPNGRSGVSSRTKSAQSGEHRSLHNLSVPEHDEGVVVLADDNDISRELQPQPNQVKIRYCIQFLQLHMHAEQEVSNSSGGAAVSQGGAGRSGSGFFDSIVNRVRGNSSTHQDLNQVPFSTNPGKNG